MGSVERRVIFGPMLGIVLGILTVLSFSLSADNWTRAQAKKGGGSSSTNTSTSSTSSSGGTSTSSSSSGDAVQTGDTSNMNHAIVVDFDGQPTSISGVDHDLDGDTTNSTGTVPAIGVPHYAVGGLEGTATNDNIWIMAQASNNAGHAGDDQTEGGISNNLQNRESLMDQMLQSIKFNAHYRLDTSNNVNQQIATHYGTANNPVIVYCAPSDKLHENEIHFAGQGTSYGLLAIEINDPKMGGIIMNANYQWQGLVMIVLNYRDTNQNSCPIDMNGSGATGDGHILGGCIVYHRNQSPSASDQGELMGDTFADLGGGGRIWFSSDALRKIRVPSAFQVKSWRVRVD